MHSAPCRNLRPLNPSSTDQVIAPNLANVSGQWEEKLVVVGITKLIVEAPQLQAQENQGVAGKLLDALLRLLDGTSSSAGASGTAGKVEEGGNEDRWRRCGRQAAIATCMPRRGPAHGE